MTKIILRISLALLALFSVSPLLAQGKAGDVNGDAAVDVADIGCVIDFMAGKGSVAKTAADVNNDNNVDVADIGFIIDVMAGKYKNPGPPANAAAVDLGLPSGTLWANMNVGAEVQNEPGLYFAWGETVGYAKGHTFDWASYKWMAEGKSDYYYITKYQVPDKNYDGDWYNMDFEFIGDSKIVLDLEDDAAHASWGGGWRMPTKEEVEELAGNTTYEYVSLKGTLGFRLTSKLNGKSIFLPAMGCMVDDKVQFENTAVYWSSTLDATHTQQSVGLYADDESNTFGCAIGYRYIGQTIRPVKSRRPEGLAAIDLGLPSGKLWANMNIGAYSIEEYGEYYAWGETALQGDGAYSWQSYKLCNGSENTLTKYCDDASYGNEGFTDGLTQINISDDVANVMWEGEWLMPTASDMRELLECTTQEFTQENGVNGYRLISLFNGKSIFLPAAGSKWNGALTDAGQSGCYWSSTLSSQKPTDADYMVLDEKPHMLSNVRASGKPVRAVRNGGTPYAISLSTPSAVEFKSEESSKQIAINTNYVWRASCSESWCTLSPASGTQNGMLTISVAENTGEQRSAVVVVRAGDLISAVTVTQKSEMKPGTAIDMGLPSGTLWADMNVGAETPEDYGEFYAWGETCQKSTYNWSTYKYCAGTDRSLTKYCNMGDYGFDSLVDNLTTLTSADDVATENWGTDWRMPTNKDVEELIEYTTFEQTTQNDVVGYKLTSKANGNSIFLPLAGFRDEESLKCEGKEGNYWAAEAYEFPSSAYYMFLNKEKAPRLLTALRMYGMNVRPVKDGTPLAISLEISDKTWSLRP